MVATPTNGHTRQAPGTNLHMTTNHIGRANLSSVSQHEIIRAQREKWVAGRFFCAICGGPFSSQVDMDCEGTDERAYRFDILEHCNLEWLDELRALGINPDATGSDKFVVTRHQRLTKLSGLIF